MSSTIQIDLAGVLENMTPEMFDETKDLLIESLIKSGKLHMDMAIRFGNQLLNHDIGSALAKDINKYLEEFDV